jgi:hypothetical protein
MLLNKKRVQMNRSKKNKEFLKIILDKLLILYSKIVKRELLNQKVIRDFNKNIDNIYADDGLPESAKIIKMAKLLEKNPEVPNKIDGAIKLLKTLESNNKYRKFLPRNTKNNSNGKN